MPVCDVLIIGGGPAGLSTAFALSKLLFKTTIFDPNIYQDGPTHHMHNVLGFEHFNSSEFRTKARHELTTRHNTTTFHECQIKRLKRRSEDGWFKATKS